MKKNVNGETILKVGVMVLTAASAILNTVYTNRTIESGIKREVENYMKNSK